MSRSEKWGRDRSAPGPTPAEREPKVLLHKDKERSECFGGASGLPRPSHFPTGFFQTAGGAELFLWSSIGRHAPRKPKPKAASTNRGDRFLESGQPDLNRRPRRPERRALPGCAMPRLNVQACYRANSESGSAPASARPPSCSRLRGSSMVIHTSIPNEERSLEYEICRCSSPLTARSSPFAVRHRPNSSYMASMRSAYRSSMTLRRSLRVGVRVPSSTVNGSGSSRKLRIFSCAAASRL
jgi:hypothetical protein